MPRQHALIMLVLAALAGSCGDRTKGSDIWATVGSSPVPAAGTDAAGTICQKLFDCGAFQTEVRQASDDTSPVAYVVAAIEQAQTSKVLDSCTAELKDVFAQVESRGVNVPWDGVATCLAAADCALLKSEDGALSVAGQCAAQLGIPIGSTTVTPQPQPPPVRRDAGVTFPDFGVQLDYTVRRDSGVVPSRDSGTDADADAW